MPDDPYSLRQTVPPTHLSGKPYLKEDGEEVALHFDFRTVQSAMSKADPDALTLGYTRTMMAFLLFQPEPARIAMIGLGGGSMAKYCLRHLPGVDFTAVEISPEIIALRDDFRLPPDGERFRVVCADGADYIRAMNHTVDVLLLDGFDLEGQPRQLCSTAFYDYCFARLNPGGVLLYAAEDALHVLGARREALLERMLVDDAAARRFRWNVFLLPGSEHAVRLIRDRADDDRVAGVRNSGYRREGNRTRKPGPAWMRTGVLSACFATASDRAC